MEVKIAVVKEWFNGFVPTSEMEERFKEAVKEALEHVTQDFKVVSGDTFVWDPNKTWKANLKEIESLGGRPMRIYEYRLMWAKLVAEGHDVIGIYYASECCSSQKPEVDPVGFSHIDRATVASWLTIED